MPTFEHTIEIAAPVEYVFEFNTNPENWPKATPSMSDIEIVEETDDGYLLHATYRMLGMSIETEIEETIVEENAHTTSTFNSDDMSGTMDWYFEETDDGTHVRLVADYEFSDSLLNRIMRPVATRYNERQFRQTLSNSKDLIEAELEAEARAKA